MTMSREWRNTPVDEWNTNLILAYIADRHEELYGVEYVPWRSWATERGMIGRLVGTKRKPGTHSAEQVKRFVDECFREYRPTRDYPGVSFGWCWTYKKPVWQRVLAEDAKAKRRAEIAEQPKVDFDELAEWL